MAPLIKTSIVVPVYNPGEAWLGWLNDVDKQTIQFSEKVIIDSSSTDGYVERSTGSGFRVITIPQEQFDHGATRQLALDYIGDAEIVVFLTQDAFPENSESIRRLIDAFDDEKVAIAYGRQLPNRRATPIEAHARLFNYPDRGHVYGFNDRDKVGLKAAFNSNSFSAYRVSALKAIDGFRSKVIFGEDMLAAAFALKNNYSVCYRHDACVFHSHAYTLIQEFQRYFDMGVMHSTHAWLLSEFGKPSGEGFRYVRSELSYLSKKAPWRIPEAMIRTAFKFSGYRLGLIHRRLPRMLNVLFSMNKRYWD